MAGRSGRKANSKSPLPSEYRSLNGKLVTSALPARSERYAWQMETHSTPAGSLELAFDARSRKYLAARVAGVTHKTGSPDRPGIMPLLESLGAVPTGWRKIYGGVK